MSTRLARELLSTRLKRTKSDPMPFSSWSAKRTRTVTERKARQNFGSLSAHPKRALMITRCTGRCWPGSEKRTKRTNQRLSKATALKK